VTMPGVRVLAALAALAAVVALARRLWGRATSLASARIRDPEEHTVMDSDGKVRSVQAADVTLPARELERLWVPVSLERLARTYWRFLTRVTLGLIQVRYRPDGRDVTLLGLIPLLTFEEPEYEMDGDRGIVRWRIEKGILVSKPHEGYLEIDVSRAPTTDPATGQVHVEVEVANFYPAIAHRLSRFVYTQTQSRIHVIVTHGFLRSLASLDLAESRVGRFARVDEVPDPRPSVPTQA
jgi:hypothetical protein